MKIFKGLFGVSSDGKLYDPSGNFIIKLHKKIAFKIQYILNHNFVDMGLINKK